MINFSLVLQCTCFNTVHSYFISGDGGSFLTFNKGDLIVLNQQSGESVMNSGWCVGECIRTSQKGDFPAECVYVLPTITKPPMEILVSNTQYLQHYIK